MSNDTKTHFRKAFDSPYLASVDIVEPIVLTIRHVRLEPDKTKQTRDLFNTAYFVEEEIRPGEKLKPMILNATNSKTLKAITGSAFLEDWGGARVRVHVDNAVRFGKDTVEGLRITAAPPVEKKSLTPDKAKAWDNAKAAFKRDGHLQSVLSHVSMSEEHQMLLMDQCAEETGDHGGEIP